MNVPPSTIAPLPYRAEFEHPEEGEEETAAELNETLHAISVKVAHDEGHAYRSVHAKRHGILKAELEVLAGLPESLAQGLFREPGRYPAIMRFSTPPGDLLDDKVSTPRALAVKVVGVDGAREPGNEAQVTQDFLLVNGPVFSAPTARKFLKSLKLLAATTDKAPGLKRALSAALRGVEAILEKAGSESATVKALGGHPLTHILGETFYTQVPMLYGQYMAKLSIAPVSPGLLSLTDAPIDTDERPNAIRDAVVDHFRSEGGEWEVRVQLCVDIETMPIEDASVQWPEDASPFVTVARIVAEPQRAWSDKRAELVEDRMSFSPWHALAAHRPIGSIMRVRKAAYAMAARFRAEHNAVKIEEPRKLDEFPD
ncbi:catalase family protein [Variovorax robiniae]|uniref:Catalase family protein n=1 Tax=Variovorax robiniae TaxID=1836199 RepID=A0ABU8XIY4_9BURK